jgi:hypothetical protein
MYGRLTSSVFSISTTRRICKKTLSMPVQASHQRQKIRKSTDVDGPETSTVTSRHVLIKGFHRIRATELTELLVHVVCARARVVAKPYTEVLHLQRLLFVDLKKPKKKTQSQSTTRSNRDAVWSAFPSACLLRAAWDNAG